MDNIFMAVERFLRDIFKKKRAGIYSKQESLTPFDKKIAEMLAHLARVDDFPVFDYEPPNENKPESKEPPK